MVAFKEIQRIFFRNCGVFAMTLTLLAVGISARAEILFEGYSSVALEGVHVGFVVQRFEFDSKKQEYTTAYYLKTNQIGGNITESLKARSNSTLKPVSYQFTELVGDKVRTIDAQFKGENMTATVIEGGKKQIIQKKVPKNAFLASFLGYVMLQGRDGIKKGAHYSYKAIAEEDAAIYDGEAYVNGEETINGINAFKILNTFKSTQFISYCTYKAEVVATRSPVQKISTELVAGAREATSGLSLNTNSLTQLFGNVPVGTENPVARRAAEIPPPVAGAPAPSPNASAAPAPGQASPDKIKKLEARPTPSTDSPKKYGVPGGTGIHLKGQPGDNQ